MPSPVLGGAVSLASTPAQVKPTRAGLAHSAVAVTCRFSAPASLGPPPLKPTSAALPNHPGAVDYFNREQESFMDRYGDWLWLLLFAGGGISSALAWIGEVFARKRRELVDEVLDRLTSLISEARHAKTLAELDAVTTEIDHLVTHAIRYARQQGTNTRAMSALILAIDAAREAVADHRRDLEGRRSSAGRLVQLFPERG